MATRPWITSADVKDYTEFPKVKERPDPKLQLDIVRAEQYIISRTNNKFDDNVAYPMIPEPVKLATILVAEFYANTAADDASKFESETFDDYSYTRSDVKVEDLDLEPLLKDYVIVASKNQVSMKLRKL
jgi:hypothetical protein